MQLWSRSKIVSRWHKLTLSVSSYYKTFLRVKILYIENIVLTLCMNILQSVLGYHVL